MTSCRRQSARHDDLLLVPVPGSDGWFWHQLQAALEPRGHRAIAVTLPGDNDAAGLAEIADAIVEGSRAAGPVVLVAQSMGGFSAPLAVDRLDVERLVLLDAMVPAPGERPGLVGGGRAGRGSSQRRASRPPAGGVRRRPRLLPRCTGGGHEGGLLPPQPDGSDRTFEEPWPLETWPDVPTSGLAGADDRLFPVELQQRVARDRLGIDLEVVPGGHLVALANPEVVADRLVAG